MPSRCALLVLDLQRVVARRGTRLDQRDVGELRIGPEVERIGLARRLIEITRGNQVVAARTDVGDLDRARGAELPLDVEVPVLHPWRLQIALVRGGRLRNEHRERRGERIVEREEGQARVREVHAEIEVRRVEVQPLRRRQRPLVVVDPVAAAQHRARRLVDRPGEPGPRREVVAIGLVAAARHAVAADRRRAARSPAS